MTKENLWSWLSEKITTEGDDMLKSIPLKKLNGIYYLGWAHVVKIFLWDNHLLKYLTDDSSKERLNWMSEDSIGKIRTKHKGYIRLSCGIIVREGFILRHGKRLINVARGNNEMQECKSSIKNGSN